jgi:hypothetical protein
MPPVLRGRAALAVALVVLAACGGGGNGDDGASPGGPSSVLPSVVSTAMPTTVPDAPLPTAPVTTVSRGAACGESPVPAGAADTTTATADVDGDGRGDSLSVYRVGPADQIASWHLRAQLGAGGAADLTLSGANPAGGPVSMVGGAKVDGDASEEIWARVGAGASRLLVGLFVFRSCHLEPVILNREPAVFPLGGTVRIQTGLECTDGDRDGTPDLVAYEAESNDGTAFVGTGKVYRQSNATLTLVATVPISYSVTDSAARRYGTFTCGALRL